MVLLLVGILSFLSASAAPPAKADVELVSSVFAELTTFSTLISTLTTSSVLPLACAQLIPAAANFSALVGIVRAGGDARAVAAAVAPPAQPLGATPTPAPPRALLSSARGPLDDALESISAAAASLDARARAAAATLKALDVPLSGVAALARTIEERGGALLNAGLVEGGAALGACASDGSGTGSAIMHIVRAATTGAAALVADAGSCDDEVDAFVRALRQSAEEPLSGSARGSASAAGAERARCANSAANARATAAALTAAADALGVFTTALEKAVRGFERAAVSRGGRALESVDRSALRGLIRSTTANGGRGAAEEMGDAEAVGNDDAGDDFLLALHDLTAEEESALDSLGARWLADASACASRNGLTASSAAADALRVIAASPALAERASAVLGAISAGLHATCASARDRDVGVELARALTALTRASGRAVDVVWRAFGRVVDLSSSELPDSSRAGPPMPRFYRAIAPIVNVLSSAFSGGAPPPVKNKFVARPGSSVGIPDTDERLSIERERGRLAAVAAAEAEAARMLEETSARVEEKAAAAEAKRVAEETSAREAAAAEAIRAAAEISAHEVAERDREREADAAAEAAAVQAAASREHAAPASSSIVDDDSHAAAALFSAAQEIASDL